MWNFQELRWKEWTLKEDIGEYDVYKTHIPPAIDNNRPHICTKRKEKNKQTHIWRAREMQKVGKSSFSWN